MSKATEKYHHQTFSIPIVRLGLDLWGAHWIGADGKYHRVFGRSKEDIWNAITAIVKAKKEVAHDQ